MNFPDSQRTGALGELDVIRLFTSWKWNVGRYLIDSGYDLYVTPDHAKYQGISFYVQVKGTERSRGGKVTASVSRSRLRTYAGAILPVFIVRAAADGQLYWTDAQEWALSNSSRLEGNGSAVVHFSALRRLSDRKRFEAHLLKLLPTASDKATAVDDFAERSRHLNSLDPRLGIRMRRTSESNEHHLFAKEAFEAQFSFKPSDSPENLSNLRDAIEFGLPRSIDVESFSLTGSPLFKEIGAGGLSKGTLTFTRTETSPGVVRLYPGNKHSITAQELSIDGDLFNGSKGFAVSNEGRESIFDLQVRATPEERRLTVNVGFREGLGGRVVRDLDDLRPLAAWCDQVVVQGGIFMELCFKNTRAPASFGGDRLDELMPFLHWARTLSRLHLVARTLGSCITLPEDLELGAQDVEDINLAYALLKGDRCKVRVGPQEFEPQRPITGVDPNLLVTTTTMEFSLFGQVLGQIPVGIDYLGFELEEVPGSNRVRLVQGADGQAWISHAEQDESGGWVNRALSSR